jgi:hypothetical protein
MKTTTENTFPKASVMRFADKIEYADGGVVSKQVLKNDAGNITLFAFDEEQGLAEHTAPFDALVQVLDGEAEIRIGGEPLRLKTGAAVFRMPFRVPLIAPFSVDAVIVSPQKIVYCFPDGKSISRRLVDIFSRMQ